MNQTFKLGLQTSGIFRQEISVNEDIFGVLAVSNPNEIKFNLNLFTLSSDGSKIEQYDLDGINQKIIFLPVNLTGYRDLKIEISSVGTAGNIWFEYSPTPTMIRSSSDIRLNKSSTIAALRDDWIDILAIPETCKFVNIAFAVTDTNGVSKDYEIRIDGTEIFNLDESLADTAINKIFTFIDIMSIISDASSSNIIGLKPSLTNNDATNSIVWDYAIIRFLF